MRLAASSVVGVGMLPQINEIDLALCSGVTVGNPRRDVLAAETATLTGESAQRPTQHHTAVPAGRASTANHTRSTSLTLGAAAGPRPTHRRQAGRRAPIRPFPLRQFFLGLFVGHT